MPFKRIFINSAHYWILCGLAISVELFFFHSETISPNTVNILAVIFLIFEFLNLMAHVTLRGLRNNKGYAGGSTSDHIIEISAANS